MANSFKDGMIVKTESMTAYVIGNKFIIKESDMSKYLNYEGRRCDLIESKDAWQFAGWQKEHNVIKLLAKVDEV